MARSKSDIELEIDDDEPEIELEIDDDPEDEPQLELEIDDEPDDEPADDPPPSNGSAAADPVLEVDDDGQLKLPPRKQLRRMVMDAIPEAIEPTPVTGTYKLGLLTVAAFMVMIPVFYLGLIVCTAIGTWWHFTHSFQYLTRGGGGGFMAIILYLGPLIGGIALVPFMIKPLFALHIFFNTGRFRRLKRESQPLLFEYVDMICERVGAPKPTSIRIDNNVNASAGFRHGLWSLLGRDLTLTIGLPWVKGMSLRQLTGVLAHEFGHFSQGAAMRVGYVVRVINYWLGFAAYNRDSWDEWIFRASKGADIRLMPFFYVARFFIWCQRCIMVWLYWLGHGMSGYLSREMEYDADRYETRVGGVKTFISTTRTIQVLGLAHNFAVNDLHEFMDEGRLADDWAALIASNVKFVTPEIKQELRKMARKQDTGFFDTHPCDRDRIASAKEEDTDGVFSLPDGYEDLPATVLFDDFDRISKAVTLEFYREHLGDEVKKRDLHPVDELLARQKAEIEAGKALRRYFQCDIPRLRPLPIAEDAMERPDDPATVGERLKKARKGMLAEVEVYKTLAKRFDEAEGSKFGAIVAMTLTEVGFRLEYNGRVRSKKFVRKRFDDTRAAVAAIAGKMMPYETEAGERLSCALQLLRLNRVCSRIEDGEQLRDEMETMIEEAIFVSELMAELFPFRILFIQADCLFDQFRESGHRHIAQAFLEKVEKIRTRLQSLYDELGDQLYPFDHAKADMTLREYVLPFVPDEEDFPNVMILTQRLYDRLIAVQMRLFRRLAFAAEKVETVLGLEPLPDPDEVAKAERKKKEAEERAKRKKRREARRKRASSRSRNDD